MIKGFEFVTTYAGFELDVTRCSVDHGRTLVPHLVPKRDGANVEDLGRDSRLISMDFVFMNKARDESGNPETEQQYLERFKAFEEIMQSGATRTLLHPYIGEIKAKVERFSHQSDGEVAPLISCRVTFIEDVAEPPVSNEETGLSAEAGHQKVAAAHVQANRDLAEIGVNTDVADKAFNTSNAWRLDPVRSTRQIQLELASLNSEINDAIQEFDFLSNPTRWPAYKSFILLQSNLRDVASRLTASKRRVVEVTTTDPLPLRIIATRFYGPSEAAERVQEILDLNPSITDITLVPQGTVIKLLSNALQPVRDLSR